MYRLESFKLNVYSLKAISPFIKTYLLLISFDYNSNKIIKISVEEEKKKQVLDSLVCTFYFITKKQ